MSAQEQFPAPQAVYEVDDRLVADFSGVLLPELTRDPATGDTRAYDPDDVRGNLTRVAESRNSMLWVIREDGRTTSTVTVNFTPTLTHGDGGTTWIDDVVTDPEFQGRGRSREAMKAAEWSAAGMASEVYLSSSAHRDKARAGYEKGGYELLNEKEGPDQRVIFRNSTVEADANKVSGAESLTNEIADADLSDIAGLLGVTPELIERNLRGVVDSETTRGFIYRDPWGRVAGIAIANLTPIPVGYKPWINDLAGVTILDRREVLAAAASWIGQHYEHANIVAHPDTNLGDKWVARSSGLYEKRFGGLALGTTVA